MKQTEKLETLKKQSTVAGSLVVGTVAATGAFAAPIDSLVITDINVTLQGNENYNLDLDKDGDTDFFLAVNTLISGPVFEEQAFIKTQGLDTAILANGSFFNPFQEGDSVPGTTKTAFRDYALIYTTVTLGNELITAEGPLAEVGATAYIGLVLGLPVEVNAALVDVDVDEETTGPHYGWLEVERGSLKILSAGFQTVAGLSAPIPNNVPAVPLPATLPLLLAGAGGLMALRRRKSAA